MTIPSLIQKQNTKVAISRLKKNYSDLSQAYLFARNEYGEIATWNLVGADVDNSGSIVLNDRFTKYIKTIKQCGVKTDCMPPVKYKSLNGADEPFDWTNSDMFAKTVLNDGSFMYMYGTASRPCSTTQVLTGYANQYSCGNIYIDVNGKKGPNKFGVDMFEFLITTQGIVPRGYPGDKGNYSFEKDCISTGMGRGCTAWNIYNENQDYINCSGLSWDGKRKCN